jgi:hypothetical protein
MKRGGRVPPLRGAPWGLFGRGNPVGVLNAFIFGKRIALAAHGDISVNVWNDKVG